MYRFGFAHIIHTKTSPHLWIYVGICCVSLTEREERKWKPPHFEYHNSICVCVSFFNINIPCKADECMYKISRKFWLNVSQFVAISSFINRLWVDCDSIRNRCFWIARKFCGHFHSICDFHLIIHIFRWNRLPTTIAKTLSLYTEILIEY